MRELWKKICAWLKVVPCEGIDPARIYEQIPNHPRCRCSFPFIMPGALKHGGVLPPPKGQRPAPPAAGQKMEAKVIAKADARVEEIKACADGSEWLKVVRCNEDDYTLALCEGIDVMIVKPKNVEDPNYIKAGDVVIMADDKSHATQRFVRMFKVIELVNGKVPFTFALIHSFSWS